MIGGGDYVGTHGAVFDVVLEGKEIVIGVNEGVFVAAVPQGAVHAPA